MGNIYIIYFNAMDSNLLKEVVEFFNLKIFRDARLLRPFISVFGPSRSCKAFK